QADPAVVPGALERREPLVVDRIVFARFGQRAGVWGGDVDMRQLRRDSAGVGDRLTLLLDVIEVGEQPNGRMPEAVDDRGSLVHAGDQVRLGRVEGLDRDGEAVASGGVPRDPAGILELADRLLMIPTLGHGAGSTAPEYHDLASQRGCSREG